MAEHQRHQQQPLDDALRERLFDKTLGRLFDRALGRLSRRLALQLIEEGACEALYAAAVQAPALHLLGGVVVGLQAHRAELQAADWVDVGMCYVYPSVEDSGASEDDELSAGGIVLPDPFERGGLEPHEVDDAVAVGEMCYQTAFAPNAFLFIAQYLAFYLHEGHVCR